MFIYLNVDIIIFSNYIADFMTPDEYLLYFYNRCYSHRLYSRYEKRLERYYFHYISEFTSSVT